MGIFLLDLGKDQDLEGADAKGFVDTLPNFRIDAVFDFHVVKDKLFVIDSDCCRLDLPPQFYSIELEKVSKMSNQRLDVTDLTKCSGCFSNKRVLRCLPYRDSLLIFSSRIHFEQYYYEYDDNSKKYYYDHNKNYLSKKFPGMHHFELYDPANADGCRVLPQLVVCLPRDSCDVLRLYDPDCKTFYDEGFVGFRPCGSDSYAIVSFGVDVVEDKFIIGTGFGRTFSLKLDGSDYRWRLCGEDEEGYYFKHGCKTIITWNGVCLDAFGATDSRTRWLKQQQKQIKSKSDGRMRAGPSAHKQKQYGDGSSRFPPRCKEIEKCGLLFRAGPYSSAFDLQKLKGNDPSRTRICIVRQAFDYIGARYDRSSKLYLWVNVLEVDLQELAKANDDHDLDDDKIVKRLKSFKYAVPETIYMIQPFVEGLFYY